MLREEVRLPDPCISSEACDKCRKCGVDRRRALACCGTVNAVSDGSLAICDVRRRWPWLLDGLKITSPIGSKGSFFPQVGHNSIVPSPPEVCAISFSCIALSSRPMLAPPKRDGRLGPKPKESRLGD
jgi:hypothetical protein